MSPRSPSPRPAATVMLARDAAAGLETFMVVRHHEIEFASGALVFPGGKIDPGDGEPAVLARTTGIEGLTPADAAIRIGAIRELFEEAGVLLARRKDAAGLLGGREVAALRELYQKALVRGTISMAKFAGDEGLELAGEALVPFARWIAPEIGQKRFDTNFFLTALPAGQAPAHDGVEAVESFWIRPMDALAEADAGRHTVLFPTRMNLLKLGRSATVAEAAALARSASVVTVQPRVERREDGITLRIPAEAGYGVTEMFVPNSQLPPYQNRGKSARRSP